MQVLVFLIAIVLVATAKTKALAKKVYNEATKKAAELKKQGGNNE